jgi:hypothetical protein
MARQFLFQITEERIFHAVLLGKFPLGEGRIDADAQDLGI